MISLNITNEHDVVLLNQGTLATVQLSVGHQTVSNLVRARVVSEIDWQLFLDNDAIDDAIIAQQVRTVLLGTNGVVSADLTNFEVTRSASRGLNIHNVCFTVDCDNKLEEFTL